MFATLKHGSFEDSLVFSMKQSHEGVRFAIPAERLVSTKKDHVHEFHPPKIPLAFISTKEW